MAEAALEVARAKLTDLKAGTRPEEIDKAQENVREAEENAAFTKIDLERIIKLVESGALPGEEHEKARVKYIAAEAKLKVAVRQLEMLKSGFTNTTIAIQEASVKEAAAKLAMAQARLNECVISAPFFGTVTKVFVRAGDMAALKTPLLELADLSSLVVRSSVPEAYASEVQLGMMGQIRLDALPEKVFKAEVTRVFPELDQRMRTRTIELSIQEKVNLVPNLFGRVKLILKLFPDAIAIPAQAVIVNPKGDSVVFVVIDGKAIQRKIKTGIEDSGRIQVLSGMKPGEQVIVSGQEKLKDGIEIRLPGTISKGQSKNTPKEKSSSEGK
jgi:multidrug efflux pump subunit AcrA (membrane-fusion protein)